MLEAAFIQALAKILGHDNVLVGEEDLERYSATP